MKKTTALATVLAVFLVLGSPGLSLAERWYVGGTLQDATVRQWQESSYGNKLATAAIWAIMEPKVRNICRKSSTMASVKPYAEELVGCIGRISSDYSESDGNVSSLAATCMVSLGW